MNYAETIGRIVIEAGKVLGILAMAGVVSLILALPFYFVWNMIGQVGAFEVPHLNLFQGWAILALARMVLGKPQLP